MRIEQLAAALKQAVSGKKVVAEQEILPAVIRGPVLFFVPMSLNDFNIGSKYGHESTLHGSVCNDIDVAEKLSIISFSTRPISPRTMQYKIDPRPCFVPQNVRFI